MKLEADLPEVETIAPVDRRDRIFSLSSYTLMMWSTLITIQAFVIGQTFLPPYGQLNLLQGFCVMLIASFTIAVFMSWNGEAGLKYGIPFAIHVRASFGVRGSKLPQVLRLFPGIIWYGVGTWIAALSMDGIVATVTGFNPPGMKFVYFIALQAIQTWLAYKGVRFIKWFNAGASILLVAIMGYMMIHVVRTHGVQFNESWNTPGSWGLPFWIAINSVIGVMAALIANSGDLSRYIEPSRRSLWWGNVLGIVPPLIFMVTLGVMAGIATNEWNAVNALMQMSPNLALMLLLLVFVLVAQFTTALAANILPVSLILQEAVGITWNQGVLAAGILGALAFPWLILKTPENVVLFISYYTCFFGPIAGCMIADFVLRKGNMDLESLYRKHPDSQYWFRGGVNWAGILATLLPAAITMIWTLKISWIVGLPLGFLFYLILFPLLSGRVTEGEIPHTTSSAAQHPIG